MLDELGFDPYDWTVISIRSGGNGVIPLSDEPRVGPGTAHTITLRKRPLAVRKLGKEYVVWAGANVEHGKTFLLASLRGL